MKTAKREKTLAARLAEARRAKGLTQAALAAALGVSVMTVSRWERGANEPHKALERPCHWRRVAKLPWLKPWKGDKEN